MQRRYVVGLRKDQVSKFWSSHLGAISGYLDNAWVFMRDTGVVGWSCIPYIAMDATCPATKCNSSLATTYHASGCYKLGSIKDIQAEILLNGPVEGT
jgi:hypothetical protein